MNALLALVTKWEREGVTTASFSDIYTYID